MKQKTAINSDFIFILKSRVLMARRMVRDLLNPIKRHGFANNQDKIGPVLHEVKSSLLTKIDPSQSHLRTGKIENIRICTNSLDGIYIPKGEIFSFWQQVGRTTRAKGFVDGREMRGGRLIPTIGGGICQLSSAIYQAAKHAGMEIIERHEHTNIVEGAAFPKGEDANLFWNYVDLRFRATEDLFLSVKILGDELIVCLYAKI